MTISLKSLKKDYKTYNFSEKDHNRVHDLISKSCKTHIESNFQDRLYVYMVSEIKLKQGGWYTCSIQNNLPSPIPTGRQKLFVNV